MYVLNIIMMLLYIYTKIQIIQLFIVFSEKIYFRKEFINVHFVIENLFKLIYFFTVKFLYD